MKVTFAIKDSKALKEFFNQTISFLDVCVERDTVKLISSGVEAYCHKVFEIISSDDFTETVYFRLDRKNFLDLLRPGTVSFFVSGEGMIEIGFHPKDGPSFELTRPQQSSDITSILKFTEILGQVNKFKPILLTDLEKQLSLIRQFGSVITVRDNVLHAKMDNIELYYKVNCENLSIFAPHITYLVKNSELTYAYRNFIVGSSVDSAVIVQQARGTDYFDINIIDDPEGRKRTHLAKVDFTAACSLAGTIKHNGLADVDLDTGTVKFTIDNLSYKTRVDVHEVLSREKMKTNLNFDSFDFTGNTGVVTVQQIFPKLRFPSKLFNGLLSSVVRTNVHVSLRKTFVVFSISDKIFLVVGRSQID